MAGALGALGLQCADRTGRHAVSTINAIAADDQPCLGQRECLDRADTHAAAAVSATIGINSDHGGLLRIKNASGVHADYTLLP